MNVVGVALGETGILYSADGDLLFQQVPMVEIDGMKLVQTKAILNYIADKYQLHGKDPKDRAMYEAFLNCVMNVHRCMSV